MKQKKFKFYIDEFRTDYSPVSLKRMERPIKTRFARTQINQMENLYHDWKPHVRGALPSNLIEISSESQRVCDNHIACFPTALPERFILGMTDKNDIVVDPFCGTGSTLCAAKKNGRNYLGIDISEEYVNFSINRLNAVDLPLDKNLVAKIEKDSKIIEDYKNKTKDTNVGRY